ncbi:MAG: site-specific integrase [Eubacteriales bacterium]|nr:site-specific integrase [Eubacteriales bacterium]
MKKQKKENGSGTFRIVNGKYNYRFFYIDEFGEKKRKSFSGVTKDECLQRAEEFLEKQEKRVAAVDPDITIPELLRRKYEEDYAMNFVGEQGYARNLGGIALLERSGFGKMPIVDITEMQIKAFLRSMTTYSDSVIKKTYQQLTAAFKVAVEKGVVERNPMDASDIRRPKSSKKPKDVRGFTQEEQARFLEALRDFKVPRNRNEYKLQLLIELYSGMRMGEINALKPENIDFENGLIHVRSTVSRGLEYRVFIKEGAKTDAGVRDIPINKALEPVLQDAMERKRRNPLGLVFYDHLKNDLITTSQVNCFFHRICKKAEISVRGQHALRHTFATRCIEADVPPVVLKKWLGHKDIHMTLDIYADVFDSMHNSAMEKFEGHVLDIGC